MTKEQKGTYERIYSGVRELSAEVEDTKIPGGFDDYLARVNNLERSYIEEFDEMNNSERTNASLLISMVINQIHGKVDIFRARAMRGELSAKPSPPSSKTKIKTARIR